MLASYYNMTIHTFHVGAGVRRDYMLEVNPKYTDPSYDDTLNVIDARWIDIETGLFIDITAVRPHMTKKGIMCSKDQHEEKVSFPLQSLESSTPPAISPTQIANKPLQVEDLFPLRDSIFEDQPVKIPYNYDSLLTQEYENVALTKTTYSNHHFNSTSMEWERLKSVSSQEKRACQVSQVLLRGGRRRRMKCMD